MSTISLAVALHAPLLWPDGWRRTLVPQRSRFDRTRSFAAARNFLRDELVRLGVYGRAYLTTNLRLNEAKTAPVGTGQPVGRGVSVYFRLDGRHCVLACDSWDRVECNAWAIALHIEALRALGRYQVGSLAQAFGGYLLPENSPPPLLLTVEEKNSREASHGT